jgi:hypothetical protein
MTRLLLSSLAIVTILSAPAVGPAAGADYYFKLGEIAGEYSPPKKARKGQPQSTLARPTRGQSKAGWPSKIQLQPPIKERR